MRDVTRWTRLRLRLLVAASIVVMTVAAAAILCVALATAFRARRLYAFLATWLARGLLAMWGIRLALHRAPPWPRTQTVFISNHPSTLDLFMIVALGLPRTRFFLSGFLQKYVPLGIIARLLGTFFTVPQTQTDERRRIFAAAARTLQRSGESVYLSPEGGRVPGDRVGPFNKGAFHLASSLRAPIVPLLFVIPPESDPGRGFDIRPGVVHVHVGPTIDTSDWRVADIATHRDAVHDWFVAWQTQTLEHHRAHDAPRDPVPAAAGAR